MSKVGLSVAEIIKGDHFLKDERKSLFNEMPNEIKLRDGKATILDQDVVLTVWGDGNKITVGYKATVNYELAKFTKESSVVGLDYQTQFGDYVDLPMDATLKDIVEATNKNIEKVKELIVDDKAIKKLFDDELQVKKLIVW